MSASDTEYETLGSLPTIGSFDGFIKAVLIWLNKPHVINRRLCGSKVIKQMDISLCGHDTFSLTKDHQCFQFDVLNHEYGGDKDACSQEIEFDILAHAEKFMVIRDLLPKNSTRHSTVREIVILDHSKQVVTFHPVSVVNPEPRDDGTEKLCPASYRLCYLHLKEFKDQHHIELQLQRSCETDDERIGLSPDWMKQFLLPKIVQWSGEKDLKTSPTSLRLVPVDEYSDLYQQLKQKHGHRLVENWTEKTDPQKFVFEDIAIATYLLLLWQEDRRRKNIKKKQTFVDLGCGNGLLVYILACEGHQGLGIDVRKRQIWDMFMPVANLKECPITPSAHSLFPEYDWIIGNHSDELTPWIPVIAARSSFTCCYFVLPCCHFDFDTKFSYKQKGSSQYHTYLDFIREVGEKCGFSVEEDTLRIPSTKRVCFVGKTRTYSECEEQAWDKKRSDYISSRCDSRRSEQTESVTCDHMKTQGLNIKESDSASNADEIISCKRQKIDTSSTEESGKIWSKNFKPRCNTEITRNCQKVDRHVKEHIIKTVFDALINVEDSSVESRPLPNGKLWRKGGIMPLSKVVNLFDRDVLQSLKSECGGLQTLLKNQSSVFRVIGGTVRIRDPYEELRQSKKSKQQNASRSSYYKTAPCWFYENHPDGCPKLGEDCNYAHGDQELKERPSNKTIK